VQTLKQQFPVPRGRLQRKSQVPTQNAQRDIRKNE